MSSDQKARKLSLTSRFGEAKLQDQLLSSEVLSKFLKNGSHRRGIIGFDKSTYIVAGISLIYGDLFPANSSRELFRLHSDRIICDKDILVRFV